MLAIASIMWAITGCAGAETPDGKGDGQGDPQISYEPLTVMSFNIRVDADSGDRSWSSRKDNVFGHILEKDADIVCLQEVKESQYADITENLSDDYNIIYYTRDNSSNSEGLAILYKDNFRLISEERFWLSETPDEMSKGWGAPYYRICVNVRLRSLQGADLNIFNVHLDSESELARENGLKLIIDKANQDDATAILCGDFNATRTSECYTIIANEMQDVQKVAPVTDEGVTWHNWGNPTIDGEIDFCFVSDGTVCKSFDICDEKTPDDKFYSDHYAILSQIDIPIA